MYRSVLTNTFHILLKKLTILKIVYKILYKRQNRDERQLYTPHHDVTGYNGERLHLFAIKLIVKANG